MLRDLNEAAGATCRTTHIAIQIALISQPRLSQTTVVM
jgi:hypothetical protein